MDKQLLKRFKNIPTLKTERLILRRIERSDLEDVFAYASDPKVPEYLLWSVHPSRAYTKAYLALLQKRYALGEFYDWGIEYNGHIVGTVGFTSFSPEHSIGEVGYVLSSKVWGKGIASEALAKIMEYGFLELGLNRLEARFMVGNDKSKSLLLRSGFSAEGVIRSGVFAKGDYKDVELYSILRSEYFKSEAK